MRYLLLRNEESVRDVAEKAYKGLSVTARKKAEEALLKANPELKKFESVRKGSIIRIPAFPEGAIKNRVGLVDPVEEIAHEMAGNLKLFENSLKKKFTDLENRQKNILENLKAANKELNKQPNGAAAAKRLKEHVANSKKLNDKNKKLGLEALEKLQKTTAAFNL